VSSPPHPLLYLNLLKTNYKNRSPSLPINSPLLLISIQIRQILIGLYPEPETRNELKKNTALDSVHFGTAALCNQHASIKNEVEIWSILRNKTAITCTVFSQFHARRGCGTSDEKSIK
jgi:hypothetical protein